MNEIVLEMMNKQKMEVLKLAFDIKDDLKEAIDNLIDERLRGLKGCVGEKEFGELVDRNDYQTMESSQCLDEVSEMVAKIVIRLDSYYKENY